MKRLYKETAKKKTTIVKRLSASLILMGIVICILADMISSIVLYQITEQEMIENLDQMSEQSIQYLNTVMQQFEQEHRFLQSEDSLGSMIKEYEREPLKSKKAQIEELLNVCYSSFEDVYGIVLMTEKEIFQNIGGDVKEENIRNAQWYQQYKENKKSRQYSPLVDREGNVETQEEKKWIFLAYPYQNKTVAADLIFLIPFSTFEIGMKTYQEEGIAAAIYDSSQEILYQNEYQMQIKEGQAMEIRKTTRIGQWTLQVCLPEEKIMEQSMPQFLLCFLILFLSFLVIWGGILKMTAKNLKPVKDFSDQMELISKGTEECKVQIHSGDELECLAETFNEMMERIHISVKEQILAENKQKQLEYALIHAQIDPHFIYKALNVIIYLGQCKENEQLIKVTRALIEILQDKLRIDQIDIYDTLEKELEVIRAYVTIWKVYYGERIHFIEEAKEDVRKKKLPKNIIQPLIENAIFHGLLLNEDEEGNLLGGTVSLRVEQENGYLKIEVEDNGYGMTQEQIEHVFFEKLDQNEEKGKHIGIRNIRQRLRWIYKEEYSIKVESELEQGTKVILSIREEQDE